nr:MAG TPA: hypothetical protein [Caudoviricetes sp.]
MFVLFLFSTMYNNYYKIYHYICTIYILTNIS